MHEGRNAPLPSDEAVMQPLTTACRRSESEMKTIRMSDRMMMLSMKCLVDNFGLVNAEQFINSVRAACPDCTAWRRQMFDGMYVDDVFRMADEDTDNPSSDGRLRLWEAPSVL